MDWISNFINKNYVVLKTNPNGNCYFECLERAVMESGINTELKTIKDFRRYLKNIVTEDYYQ